MKFWNSKNELTSKANPTDYVQGAKKIPALQPNVKSRMKELQSMARKSLKGETHNIYRTKF